MIAVLGALRQEVAALEERLATSADLDVIVVCCGVGKVQAAAAAADVCRQQPEAVLSVGLCGALDDALAIGDVVVATEAVQHDMDASPLGFDPGEVPYTNRRVWRADDTLRVRLERSAAAGGASVHAGRVLSGDRFIADAAERARLAAGFGAVAVDMEGAAVGVVAAARSVPWGILRVVSDRADGQAPGDFTRLLHSAAQVIAASVVHLARSRH